MSCPHCDKQKGGNVEVWLNTHITPLLLLEGMFNEFEHHLNTSLKKNNIAMNDPNIPRSLVADAIKKSREASTEDIKQWGELGYIPK